MLVLTRKLDERIIIAGNIEITVVSIDRGKVRLGITAPREIPVFRSELLDKVVAPSKPNIQPSALNPTVEDAEARHVNSLVERNQLDE